MYKCTNGQWVSQGEHPNYSLDIPCAGIPPGDSTGAGYPTGWRSCDVRLPQLCEWNNTTKKWTLIQDNSPICINNNIQHRCYVSTNTNYVTCGNYAGTEPHQCDTFPGLGEGCLCDTGNCKPECWCCTDDYKCRRKCTYGTPGLFYITRTSPNVSCWTDPGTGAQLCQYDFNTNGMVGFRLPMAFKSLHSARIHYENGPLIGEWCDVRIAGRYANTWYPIWEATPWLWGATSVITLPEIYHLPAPKCMDAIAIALFATGSNPRMKAFECTFNI